MGQDIDANVIEKKVIEIISEQMGIDKAEITRDISFIDDLNADSLDTVELVMEFEDEFGMCISDEEAEKIQTVGEAIDYLVNAMQNAESPNSYSSRINEIIEYFVNEPNLYRPEDIIKKPKLISNKKGIYGWYFDELPQKVPLGDYFTIEGYKLLYIGIAGKHVHSKNNLRKRICTFHLNRNANDSTLRKSLGTLLRDKLVIQPYKKGRDFWFGTSGEKMLTEWMTLHSKVAWVVDERPWEIEKVAFTRYGNKLPLNIDENENNPFKYVLKKMRSDCQKEAND